MFPLECEPDATDMERCEFVVRRYANKRELQHFPRATVRAYASNMEAQAAFILSGQLIGYLPDHFASHWVSMRRLHLLVASRRIDSPFVVVTSGGAKPPPLVRLFIGEITAHATGECGNSSFADSVHLA